MSYVSLAVSSQWVAALDMKWIFKVKILQSSLTVYFEPAIIFGINVDHD